VRTWAYVSNRRDWLADAQGIQETCRAVEDKLSDALHEALTLRFVDRRSSVLLRRLADDADMTATVDPAGDVLVEGEYVGRLTGFRFQADPRAEGPDGRALRSAANRPIMRHTLSQPVEQVFGAIHFHQELEIERFYALSRAGDLVPAAPFGRIGLLFANAKTQPALDALMTRTVQRDLYSITSA
jgi:hypothetical protein